MNQLQKNGYEQYRRKKVINNNNRKHQINNKT